MGAFSRPLAPAVATPCVQLRGLRNDGTRAFRREDEGTHEKAIDVVRRVGVPDRLLCVCIRVLCVVCVCVDVGAAGGPRHVVRNKLFL